AECRIQNEESRPSQFFVLRSAFCIHLSVSKYASRSCSLQVARGRSRFSRSSRSRKSGVSVTNSLIVSRMNLEFGIGNWELRMESARIHHSQFAISNSQFFLSHCDPAP